MGEQIKEQESDKVVPFKSKAELIYCALVTGIKESHGVDVKDDYIHEVTVNIIANKIAEDVHERLKDLKVKDLTCLAGLTKKNMETSGKTH